MCVCVWVGGGGGGVIPVDHMNILAESHLATSITAAVKGKIILKIDI